MEFRPNTRHGLWLCFLLPLAMMLSNFNTTNIKTTYPISNQTTNILAYILAIYSTFYALSTPLPSLQDSQIRIDILNFVKGQLPVIVSVTVIILLLILTKLGVLGFLLCTIGFLAFKKLLPKVFVTYKRSFSYGEGCLVLQSLIIFGAKSMLRIIYDEHNPSKVDGSFSIIANVGLVSLLGLCGLSYIPIFNFINSSNTFYLIGKYVFQNSTCSFTNTFLVEKNVFVHKN